MDRRGKEVLKGIYRIEDSCNVYVIQKGDRALVIDFGTGLVLEAIKELGISRVEAVLLTHHHRDQAEGIKRANDAGIPVFVPETEQGLVAEASEMWQAREIYNNYNNRQDRFSILESAKARPLLDYGKLSFGGIDVFVLPTPGHTTGSVSFLVETPEGIAAFTGDLVYALGKVWSLAATQWSYNGGEGIAYTILSLLDLEKRGVRWFLPSHGGLMAAGEAAAPTVERLTRLKELRRHNPRLFSLREQPYEKISEHVLFNRTSMANSYVLLSDSGKALVIDFGYDFMAGIASGTDRSARRPWLYTIPMLQEQFAVTSIDACLPTHYHDDHVAGFNLLRRVCKTKVICPDFFADILEHPDRCDLPCLWYDPIPVDRRVKCGEPFGWEEYEITPFAMSGHTRYEAAYFFEADGQKFLCTGDQYEADGTLPNYVYKNLFSWEDFAQSASLYRSLSPDWILSGHWPFIRPDEAFYDRLEETGRELWKLHEQLMPEGIFSDGGKEGKSCEDFLLRFFPYQLQTGCGAAFSVRICLTAPVKGETILELILPEGFSCPDPVRRLPEGERSCEFSLTASDKPGRRARIGCRMETVNRQGEEKLWGTQAEMLVTVKEETV